MKLKLECREVIYHSVEVDTEDYAIDENPFDLAEFINRIKAEPKVFINDYNLHGCVHDTDIADLVLKPSEQ